MKMNLYALALLTASLNTVAATQENVSIISVGVGLNPNPAMTGNFKTADKLATNCPYGVIHFNATNNIGKAMYSTILMAKAANKKLSRIDYFLDSNKRSCTLSYVEIAE